MRILSRLFPVVPIVTVLFYGATPLRANLTLIDMFRNIAYDQTSGAAPTVPASTFLNLEAFMANSGDFTSVSVVGPISTDNLAVESPTKFGEGPSFANQAQMDAAYPFGTYTFNASGASPQSATLSYSVDAFTSDIPALTASTFAALQGMNPANPFTFNFNSFTPNSNVNGAATFFTIFGALGSGGLSPSATSFVVPGGTLLPNTTYTSELDFSDRISDTDPNGVPTLIGYDVRTDITFTTGAVTPEPSQMIPMALAALGMAAARFLKHQS